MKMRSKSETVFGLSCEIVCNGEREYMKLSTHLNGTLTVPHFLIKGEIVCENERVSSNFYAFQ